MRPQWQCGCHEDVHAQVKLVAVQQHGAIHILLHNLHARRRGKGGGVKRRARLSQVAAGAETRRRGDADAAAGVIADATPIGGAQAHLPVHEGRVR